MANKELWRKKRTISLPVEDDELLTSLILRAESRCGVIRTNPSHIVRVALKALNKLSDKELKKEFNSLPPTRYGRERKEPKETLSKEELEEICQELGI
jgi:hypothetical protein